MNKFKLLITVIAAAMFSLMPSTALAYDILGNACTGAGASSPACQQAAHQNATGTNPVVERIHTGADIIALITGIAAIIMIIYSGFMYATAGGAPGGQRAGDNPNKAKQARATLTGSVIGLAIVAMAWALVTYLSSHLIK